MKTTITSILALLVAICAELPILHAQGVDASLSRQSAPTNAAENQTAGVQANGSLQLPTPATNPQPSAQNLSPDENALLESLKLNSPFGTMDAKNDSRGGNSESVEIANLKLQGVACINGRWIFSLNDAKLKKSEWVQLGETKLGCMVQSYDPKTGVLNISVEGKNYPVSLKERDQLKNEPTPPPPGAVRQGAPPPHFHRGGFRSLSPEQRREFLQNAIKRVDREIAESKKAARQNGNANEGGARRNR